MAANFIAKQKHSIWSSEIWEARNANDSIAARQHEPKPQLCLKSKR